MKLGVAFATAATVLAALTPAVADDQTVTIRGDEFKIWPFEDLIARGFDITPIPRESNAAWVYIDAVNVFEDLPKRLSDAFDYAWRQAWPHGQTKLAEYLGLPGNQRALELVRKAAGMEHCQMPCFGDPSGSVLSVLLPNLSQLRFLAKLMIAESRRLEANREYEKAIRLQTTAMRVGGHVGEGVTLIEGLVGLAVWNTSLRAIRDSVLREPLSKSHLKLLQRELNALASRRPTVRRGLAGERAFGPGVVDELCSRPLSILANLQAFDLDEGGFSFGQAGVNGNPDDGWGRLELRVGQLFFPDRAVKRHMLGFYDRMFEQAERGAVAAAAMAFDEEAYIRDVIRKWDVVSRMLLPSLSRAITLGERTKADFAATRALVALRLHMLENDGQPPNTPLDLLEALPEGALIDPFSDGLLVYRPTDDGFLLYSIGPNLVDDNGQRGKRWDELDMVYSYPPEPIEPFEAQGEGK